MCTDFLCMHNKCIYYLTVCALYIQVRACIERSVRSERSVLSSWKAKDKAIFGGGVRLIVGFQPPMVISPTASWIRWCMQVYAWWFNVGLYCLGQTLGQTILGAKSPIQFRHWWAERNHSDHLYWLRAAQSDAYLINAKLRSANLPFFTSLVWRGRRSNPCLPHPERTL